MFLVAEKFYIFAGFKVCSLPRFFRGVTARLVRGMRHFSSAEVSSSSSADSLFKVQSAFLQNKKADTYGSRVSSFAMGIPTPDWLGALHSIYIDFGPKVRFLGLFTLLPKPKESR